MSGIDFFKSVTEAPVDPILGIETAYKADPSPTKVNLGVGAYRTEEGLPHVFSLVREIERKMAFDPALNKEYNPIDGKAELKELTQLLVFGDCKAFKEKRIASAQTLSGTGALKIAGDFLYKTYQDANPSEKAVKQTIHVSKPTWGNHHQIFRMAGLEVAEYPYWNAEKLDIDFDAMLDGIKKIPSGEAVLLHPVAHNPTGMDLSRDQWKKVLNLIIERKLIPVLDTAYQGFATGDLDADAWAIRLFEESGIQLIVCQSFAKNMSLYGERIGMLHIVCQNTDQARIVLSQVKRACRANYSTPPIHGGQIVYEILSNRPNYILWKNELKSLADRIKSMRALLRSEIEKLATPGNWSHVTQQTGMFSFTGLTPQQSKAMATKHHVYMVTNGRISLAGLSTKNVEHVAKAIDDVVRTVV